MKDKKPKRFYKYILNRIKNNRNYLECVVGATGSGKSWACLSQAEDLEEMQGRKFIIDQVCFTPKELLQLVSSNKLKKGSVIVWEETGVSFDSRSALTIINKVLSYLLQTFRASNYILLMNLPFFSMLDVNARKLMHGLLEVTKINYLTNQCIVKPKLLQTNPSSGKTYFKYLRVKNPNSNRLIKITRLKINKPSNKLIEQYERKKELFNKRLVSNIITKIDKKEEQEKKESIKKPLTEKQKEVYNYLKQGMIVEEVANKLGVYKSSVYHHMKYICKKGYSIKPINKGNKVVYYEIS